MFGVSQVHWYDKQASRKSACIHDLDIESLHGYFNMFFVEWTTKNMPAEHHINRALYFWRLL